MRKLYETLLGVVETGLHPREVGVAVFLGILAGFVTGWNLSLVAVLVLALVLAVPLRVFCEVWACSAALAWALTPATYRLGVQLLEHSTLGNWLRPHAYSVWVTLFDLDRYTLVGGAVLGALAGVLAAGVAALITRSLQTRYMKLVDRFANHDDWLCRFAIRMASWVIFGSMAKPEPVRAHARMFRPVGVIAGLFLLLPGALTVGYYAPQWTTGGVLAALSAANQAEVEAADVQLSLADGLLIIDDLHIPDAADLNRDRLVLGRVLAEVKPGPLLRGEVLIDRLLIDGIETNVARAEPARPCKLAFPAFDLLPQRNRDETADGAQGESFEIALEEYLGNWEQTREKIERVRELLEEIDRLADHSRGEERRADVDAAAQVPASYLKMWAARCDFGQPRPRFLVQSLRVKNPSTKWGLGEGAEWDITNLSSNAPLTGQPTEVKFAAPELGVAVLATLNYHQPGTEHRLRIEARELAVTDLIRPEKLGERWTLAGGQLDISAVGQFHGGELNLPVMIGTSDLMLLVRGEEKLAGLSPELWNLGLEKLARFEFAGVLRGPILRPTLQVDTDALAKYFRDQLHAAGHTVLVAAIDHELNRGQVRLDEALAKATVEAQQATGAIANQAHALTDRADAKVHDAQANTQAALDRGEQSLGAAQDLARQHATQAAEEATGHVAQGQQKAADWLKEQQAHLNPLAGALPPITASAGVQSVPDADANAAATVPAYAAAQGLLGQAAQAVQQQLESRQQQTDQAITAAGEQPQNTLDAARAATTETADHAGEGVAMARSSVTDIHQRANNTIDNAAGTVQQSAGEATAQVRDAVAGVGPAAVPMPMIPPAVVEGDMVPVDYPPESDVAQAPAPPEDLPATSTAETSGQVNSAAEGGVAAAGPTVNSRKVEPAPPATDTASQTPKSAAPNTQSSRPSRYSPETIARGWVDPYANVQDEPAPRNRVTDPYGTASITSPAPLVAVPTEPNSGVTNSTDETVAGAASESGQTDSPEERSLRSAARSTARSRYASSRPYGAPPIQTERSTSEQQSANDTASASAVATGRYRSQYDPLYQEDAAAKPKAITSQPSGRYGDTPEVAAEPSVAQRGLTPPAQIHGMQPGQRYGSEYPVGSATTSKPSAPARSEAEPAAVGERRWSTVPLGELPGESTFGESPYELVSRDPTPREMPEVDPPRPPETSMAPLGRSVSSRASRGSLFGSSSQAPAATTSEPSGVLTKLRRIWPFQRESSETAPATIEGQPEAEMAQRPTLPPVSADIPAGTEPTVTVDGAAPIEEKKPWYRRLW